MTYTPPSDPGQTGGYQAPQSTPAYGAGQQTTGAAPQYSTYGNPSSSYGGYAAPKPKSDKKTFGLWAMILGISSLIIPIGLNGLAGVALGIVGLVKENSKGMSITGIVTGGIGAFVWAPIFWAAVVPALLFLLFGGAAWLSYY